MRAWLEALLYAVMLLFILLTQGCAAFPDLKTLGAVLSGQVCLDTDLGWNGGPVFSLEVKACLHEMRIHSGDQFNYSMALDECSRLGVWKIDEED